MLDPETISKIIDWMPILSMGRDGAARRPVLTRLAEQLLFSGIIAMGVIWLNQRDDHMAMEQLKESIREMDRRLERIEVRIDSNPRISDIDRLPTIRRAK